MNIYETIDKRVRSNQRREAEKQRSSTISTGTTYESIDRKNKPLMPPVRSNTISTDSQPVLSSYSTLKENPDAEDVSDPYTIGGTMKRQLNAEDVTDPYTIGGTMERQITSKITDIYADSIPNTTNQASLNQDSLVTSANVTNRESLNRESMNLEMFTPAIDVTDWQVPQQGQFDQQKQAYPTTGGRTKASYATAKKKIASHNQPEDMVSLID